MRTPPKAHRNLLTPINTIFLGGSCRTPDRIQPCIRCCHPGNLFLVSSTSPYILSPWRCRHAEFKSEVNSYKVLHRKTDITDKHPQKTKAVIWFSDLWKSPTGVSFRNLLDAPIIGTLQRTPAGIPNTLKIFDKEHVIFGQDLVFFSLRTGTLKL